MNEEKWTRLWYDPFDGNIDTSVLVTYGPDAFNGGFQATGSALEPLVIEPAIQMGSSCAGVFATPTEISPYLGLPLEDGGSVGIGLSWPDPWWNPFMSWLNNNSLFGSPAPQGDNPLGGLPGDNPAGTSFEGPL